MDRLIAILRRPEALTALVSRKCRDLDLGRGSSARSAPLAEVISEELPLYETVECPLEEAPGNCSSAHERLLQSWRQISRVRLLDGDALFHALMVILETVPADAPSRSRLPLLNPERQRQPLQPEPTAAHPRAYRGTKTRPPAPPSPPLLDLRPYLCDSRSLPRFVRGRGEVWDTAVSRLRQAGYDTRLLAVLPAGHDVRCAVHHAAVVPSSAARVPALFGAHVQSLLRGQSWDAVRRLLAVYHTMRLESRPALLAALTRLLLNETDPAALVWAEVTASHPEERQLALLTLLIETRTGELPAAIPPEELAVFSDLTPDTLYLHRFTDLLRSLHRGSSISYLQAGFRLANRYDPERVLVPRRPARDYPEELLTRIMERALQAPDCYSSFPLVVWWLWGGLPGLADVICRVDWCAFSPSAVYRFLGDFLLRFEPDDDERSARKWTFVREQIPVLVALILRVREEYQPKAIQLLARFYFQWDDPDALTAYTPAAHLLILRLAGPPFRRECDTSGPLSSLIEYTGDDGRARLLTAPDSSFRRLEDACLRENNARLISDGMEAICRCLPAFALESFCHFAGKLCRVARTLGTLPAASRAAVVEELRLHPVMASVHRPLEPSCHAINRWCTEGNGINNPMPQKLQDYLRGALELTDRQIDRCLVRLNQNLYLTRLEILEAAAIRALEEGFVVDPGHSDSLHALQMVRFADGNRRTLRKFLRGYWGGRRDYLLEHPLNRQWIAKYPALHLDVWLAGVAFTREVAGYGAIRIEVESNPLEALKLGTYAGSCLGLGGICAYSAVAVALDLNKQVLYARDSGGAVVARQIAAVSEAGRLVCFDIYPHGTAPAVVELFREYDQLFAQNLGIPLHTPGEDYTIPCILSQEWWDDGDRWDDEGSHRQGDSRSSGHRAGEGNEPGPVNHLARDR